VVIAEICRQMPLSWDLNIRNRSALCSKQNPALTMQTEEVAGAVAYLMS